MIYLLIAVGVFITDFIIKDYIDRKKEENKPEEILEGKIILHKVYNKGAIFGLGSKKPEFTTGISVGVGAATLIAYLHLLLKSGYGLLKLGLSFVVGGAASNIYDKIVKKQVVDYFSINTKIKKVKRIVFNISDWFIFLGTIIIFISQLFKTKSGK